MSKEILSSPTNDAVGELEQQVSISVCEENVESSDRVPLSVTVLKAYWESTYKIIFFHEI